MEAQVEQKNEDNLYINLQVNNSQRRCHPTDFIHGLLSSHSYLDSDEGDAVKFQDPLSIKYNQYLENWRVYTVFKPQDADDYYSVLYVNDQEKQAVLAHRGTDIPNSLKLKNESLKADLIEILNQNIGVQQEQSYISTKESLHIVQKEEYHFSTTGHSLGAWLAELSIYFLHAEFDYKDAKAITFDSPGTGDHLETYKRNVDNRETRINQDELDITTYLSAPNIVNTCNGHIGKVYRLFPKIDLPEFFKQELSSAIPKFITDRKHYVDALSAVSGHMLDPMLECFNPETGRSIITGSVLDWPHIKHDYNTTIADRVTSASNSVLMRTGLFIGKYVVNKLVPENTINSLSNVIVSFLAGDTELTQLFETYKYLNIATNETGIELKKYLSLSDDFSLSFVGHYKIKAADVNTSMRIINNTHEWKLKQLYHCGEHCIKKHFTDKGVVERLLELRNKYKSIDNGTRIKTYDIHIDDLLDEFKLILSEFPQLKNYGDWDSLEFIKEMQVISTFLPKVDNFIKIESKFDELRDALSKNQSVLIVGLPGIGKSSFVSEYARLEKETNNILVRVFSATSKDSVENEYRKLADEYGISIENIDDPSIIVKKVLSRINEQADQNGAIIIFDNVDDIEEIKECLNNVPSDIQVLLTSRDSYDYNIPKVSLQPFNKEQSIIYFEQALSDRIEARSISNDDLEKLIETIGVDGNTMPYRLNRVAAWFKKKLFDTVDDYIELYKQGGDDEPETKLLLDILDKSETSWQIMHYASYLDPDSINIEIFCKLFCKDKNDLVDDIKILQSLSLADITRSGSEVGIKVHRLTQEGIKKYITTHKSDEHISNLTEEKILPDLIKAINELMPRITNNPDDNWIKASSLYKHADKIIEEIKTSGIDINDDLSTAELLDKMWAYSQYLNHDYNKALKYQKQALDIYKNLYDGNHPDIAISLNEIGYTYQNLGGEQNLNKAQEYYEQALNMDKKLYQGNHLSIAKSLDNLGSVYKDLGGEENLKKALKCHKEALDMLQNLYQEDNCDIANSLNNIGVVYQTLGGEENLKKALEYYEEALEMRQNLFQEDHYDISNSLNNIGVVYQTLGGEENLIKALKYHEEALEMRNNLYQDDHPAIANSLNNIGVVYQTLGGEENLIKALKYHEEALEMYKNLYVGDHPAIANSLNGIGRLYQALKGEENLKEALKCHEEALEMYKNLYNSDHPDITRSLFNLGSVYNDLGGEENLKKALKCHGEALDMLQNLYPSGHLDIAHNLNSIGMVYQALGGEENLKKALKCHEEASDMYKNLYDGDHPDIANSLNNIGYIYYSLGGQENLIEALKCYEEALEMEQNLYQGNHPDIANSLNNIGCIYGSLGGQENLSKASDNLEQALEMYNNLDKEIYADEILLIKANLEEVTVGNHQNVVTYNSNDQAEFDKEHQAALDSENSNVVSAADSEVWGVERSWFSLKGIYHKLSSFWSNDNIDDKELYLNPHAQKLQELKTQIIKLQTAKESAHNEVYKFLLDVFIDDLSASLENPNLVTDKKLEEYCEYVSFITYGVGNEKNADIIANILQCNTPEYFEYSIPVYQQISGESNLALIDLS